MRNFPSSQVTNTRERNYLGKKIEKIFLKSPQGFCRDRLHAKLSERKSPQNPQTIHLFSHMKESEGMIRRNKYIFSCLKTDFFFSFFQSCKLSTKKKKSEKKKKNLHLVLHMNFEFFHRWKICWGTRKNHPGPKLFFHLRFSSLKHRRKKKKTNEIKLM